MNWVTILWSMIISACLTMGVIHLLVWGLQRRAWASLLFGLASAATAVFAAIELWMMRSTSAAEYGVAVRWVHLPVWLLILSLAGFVKVYLGAGRSWLLGSVVALRSLALVVDFLQPVNLNYREITGLRHVMFLGESVAVPVGVPNPWMLAGQLSLLLLVGLVVDAAITVWRRGERRLALTVGGSVAICLLAGMLQSLLVVTGVLHWPVIASCFFMLVITAISFEMSLNVLRSGQLAADLQESQKQMVLASSAARIGLWTRDLKSNTIRASPEWRVIFGFGPSEPLDFARFLQKVHPEDRSRLCSAVQAAVAGTGDYQAEYRLQLPPDQVRWISSRGRWESNPQTQSPILRGVSMDVTELRLAEAATIRQRAELTHFARVSNLGALAGSLAHELNQPLSAILNNAQAATRFLAATPPDLSEVRGALDDIAQDTKRAGQIIRQMRNLVRREEPNRQPLEINRVIAEIVRLLHSDSTQRKIRLTLDLDPSPIRINGDSVQLQQVVLNLVLNAFDAMKDAPDERREASLRTTRREPGLVQVAVRDGGTGISPERLRHLFEPFHSSKPEGLGLGLSICQRIVTAHDGRIWAENNAGPGATIYFTLPIVTGAS